MGIDLPRQRFCREIRASTHPGAPSEKRRAGGNVLQDHDRAPAGPHTSTEGSPNEPQAPTSAEPTSADLTAEVLGGNSSALGALFDLHRDRLRKTAAFRLAPALRGRLDADDVVQEAFLAASQRIDHFRERGFSCAFIWLKLIVQQTVIDIHRRHLGTRKRDAHREVREHEFVSDNTSFSIAATLLSNESTPSRIVGRHEEMERLVRALDELDPIDREILALRHFEELTNQEAAEVLTIGEKAASMRYVRALRRFKELASQLPGFSDVRRTSD